MPAESLDHCDAEKSDSLFAYGATITGKGPDGAPFEGAFVQAHSTKTRMLFSVLSDKQGRYRVANLPAGEYQMQVKAAGYKSEPYNGVNILR